MLYACNSFSPVVSYLSEKKIGKKNEFYIRYTHTGTGTDGFTMYINRLRVRTAQVLHILSLSEEY